MAFATAENGCTMFQNDAQHTGRSTSTGPYLPALKWKLSFGDKATIATPIAISKNGNVFVGVNIKAPTASQSEVNKPHSGIFAFDGKSKFKWISKVKGSASGTLAVAKDNTIYAHIGNDLVALNDKDGSAKWRLNIGDSTSCGMVLNDAGDIYIATTKTGTLYSISADGEFNWKKALKGKIDGCPAIGKNGDIYVTAGMRLYSINKNGKLNWKILVSKEEKTYFTTPVVADDGTIYFGAIKNNGYIEASDSKSPVTQNLYAFSPNGKKKWLYETKTKEVMMPSIAPGGNIVFVASSINYSVDNKTVIGASYVNSVSPSGALEWSWRAQDDELVGAPLIDSAGSIYVSSPKGYLTCISKNGVMKWRYGLGGRPVIGPDGTLYVVNNGLIAAIGEKPIKRVLVDQNEIKNELQTDEGSDSPVLLYVLMLVAAVAGLLIAIRSKYISKNDRAANDGVADGHMANDDGIADDSGTGSHSPASDASLDKGKAGDRMINKGENGDN